MQANIERERPAQVALERLAHQRWVAICEHPDSGFLRHCASSVRVVQTSSGCYVRCASPVRFRRSGSAAPWFALRHFGPQEQNLSCDEQASAVLEPTAECISGDGVFATPARFPATSTCSIPLCACELQRRRECPRDPGRFRQIPPIPGGGVRHVRAGTGSGRRARGWAPPGDRAGALRLAPGSVAISGFSGTASSVGRGCSRACARSAQSPQRPCSTWRKTAGRSRSGDERRLWQAAGDPFGRNRWMLAVAKGGKGRARWATHSQI
jgi:hypothetical protein